MAVLSLLLVFCSSLFANDFYPKSYGESRVEFIRVSKEILRHKFRGKRSGYKVPSETEADLYIDTVYIPQDTLRKRLVIVTTGVHGVEAFTGSSVLIKLLKNLTKDDIEHAGFLLVHGVNPYGFKKERRVTENNVDLNRNFIIDQKNFDKVNKPYGALNKFLNPQTPVTYSMWMKLRMLFRTLTLALSHGKAKMRQAIVGGQYEFNKGLFYGGRKEEPNVLYLRKLFKKIGKGYRAIIHIDIHTGYGERGKLHLWATDDYSKAPGSLEEHLYKGLEVTTGSDKDFYKANGDATSHTKLLFADKDVAGATFEFGTQNSQSFLGTNFSLRTMILENQGFHYGYAGNISEKKSKEDFLALFNPPEQEWREKALADSEKMFSTLLTRFYEYRLR